MPFSEVYSGGEGGSIVGFSSAGVVVGSTFARSGNFGFRANPTGASMGLSMAPNTTMSFGVGSIFAAYGQYFMRIIRRPPLGGGFQAIGGQKQNGTIIQMDSTGAWRIVVSGLGTVTGGSILPLNTWLRVIVKHWTYPVAGQSFFGTAASPTAAQKVKVEIDDVDTFPYESQYWTNYGRLSITGANLGVSDLNTGVLFGCIAPDVGNYEIWYDDAIYLSAYTSTDTGPLLITKWQKPNFDSNAQPLGTRGPEHLLNDDGSIFQGNRVIGYYVTAQGAFDGFTPAGSFASVAEIPMSTGADHVESGTLSAATTYTHGAMAAADTAEAICLRANVRLLAGSETHALLLDNVEYLRTLNTTSANDDANTPAASITYLTPITRTVFNPMQFGVRNKTGTATVRLRNIFLEVLTYSSGPPRGTWHQFLVAGHAVKSILSWYIGGVRQSVDSASGDPNTVAYALVPGYSAWTDFAFGSTQYVTINSKRYTIIYLLEGAHSPLDIEAIRGGTTPLTINAEGVETVGDASGTLITNAFELYNHAMKNWVLGDYQTGAWLAAPTFPDVDALSMIDETSFSAVDVIAQRRLPGGYIGAGAVGFNGNFISIRDFIATLNKSFDTDCGLNRKCQFFVSMEDDSVVTLQQQPEVSDVSDVLRGSMQVEDDFSAQWNIIPYMYRHEYSPNAKPEWAVSGEKRSAESIANYDFEYLYPTLELNWVRDALVAADVAGRKLVRHKDPPRKVSFSVPVSGFNLELGDVRALTHFGGIGANGWNRQPVRVIQHAANPQDDSVALQGYDMSRLFATIFILGNEVVLQVSWALAVGAFAGDRLYGYLADEVTGVFSDGEPGKRVR